MRIAAKRQQEHCGMAAGVNFLELVAFWIQAETMRESTSIGHALNRLPVAWGRTHDRVKKSERWIPPVGARAVFPTGWTGWNCVCRGAVEPAPGPR
jgi:hypothetical protein